MLLCRIGCSPVDDVRQKCPCGIVRRLRSAARAGRAGVHQMDSFSDSGAKAKAYKNLLAARSRPDYHQPGWWRGARRPAAHWRDLRHGYVGARAPCDARLPGRCARLPHGWPGDALHVAAALYTIDDGTQHYVHLLIRCGSVDGNAPRLPLADRLPAGDARRLLPRVGRRVRTRGCCDVLDGSNKRGRTARHHHRLRLLGRDDQRRAGPDPGGLRPVRHLRRPLRVASPFLPAVRGARAALHLRATHPEEPLRPGI